MTKKDEIKCLSCDMVIKPFNLKRHSTSKKHKISVDKKVSKIKNRVE